MIRVNRTYRKTPEFKILSDDQIQAVHSATLRILEKTGMLIMGENKEVIKILEEGGADVKGNRVRIPPVMVERALRSAPSRVKLTGRKGNGEVLLERNVVSYGLGTDVPKHIDTYTREIRSTVLKDCENIGRIVQTCENIDFNSYAGLASDIRPEMQDLYHYKAANMYCDKPYFTTAASAANLRALVEIGTIFAGSADEFHRNPSFIVYGEPISPLVFDKEATEVLLGCAEYGIPVVFPSMVGLGATGPVTLAGGLAQGSAETLASLVLHQLKNPGAPFLWGPYVSQMDLRTGIFTYAGPTFMKSQAALGQISRFYDIPTFGFAGCTDASILDAQCGMEMFWATLNAALSGLNLCHDVGYMNSGLLYSLESLLFGDEIISAVKAFMEGIVVDEEALAVDLIDQIGPSGHFLAEAHTRKHFKTEGWYPEFSNRQPCQIWEMEGSLTIEEKLIKKAHEIIEADIEPLLNGDEIREIDRIIKNREKQLS